ncbi:glycoside hydrolase family 13 protein [Nocardioides sp. NPDC057767]|uniref:glycoside hydrolase family 13 protein n=1 Tax=unclassified Nocardioides TaxID=2615069 RepID=UPI00366D3186
MDQPWWREAVAYQIYPRSFADSNGDGLGDLPGITDHLDYLAALGVDAIWICPFYTSPQNDHGYDVADYCDVDPIFGTLEDADRMIARAHELALKVIVDLVPNHTSSAHPWFTEALAEGPESPARHRYIFRDGRGEAGEEPPTNWRSVFGGPAWTRVADGQWYLHLFDDDQPDLNWHNPEVVEEFTKILNFWLDRGVDGFRVDIAHGLFKDLRDQEVPDGLALTSDAAVMYQRGITDAPMWDNPEVHEIYRAWRKLIDSFDGDRMMVAEAWTPGPAELRRYVRADEFNQAFNFSWLQAPWSAEAFTEVIESTLKALGPSRAAPTWVLSNHDVVRHRSRYGDGLQALHRARAATLTMLALPGSAYLYQGEELGLPQVYLPPEYQEDPWSETGEGGRDGCRVPLPWSGFEPPFGFSIVPDEDLPTQPWLPQPAEWVDLTVAAQNGVRDSTLEFYRAALAARRAYALGADEDVEILDAPEGVVSFRRGGVGGSEDTRSDLIVVLNCGMEPTPLPEGEIVMYSGDPVVGDLPTDSAVWILAPAVG